MKNLIILLCFTFLILFSCKKEKENINLKAEWIENAFLSLENNNYPKVKAISLWHENFGNSFLKVNSSSKSLEV